MIFLRGGQTLVCCKDESCGGGMVAARRFGLRSLNDRARADIYRKQEGCVSVAWLDCIPERMGDISSVNISRF